MIFPGESREDGEGLPGKAAPAAGRQPRRGKGAPGEEALRRAGQGQGAGERPGENVIFPGESGERTGERGPWGGQGVFTQCSWVFLAFATEPYYNKKRNWVTAPAGGEAREVF